MSLVSKHQEKAGQTACCAFNSGADKQTSGTTQIRIYISSSCVAPPASPETYGQTEMQPGPVKNLLVKLPVGILSRELSVPEEDHAPQRPSSLLSSGTGRLPFVALGLHPTPAQPLLRHYLRMESVAI